MPCHKEEHVIGAFYSLDTLQFPVFESNLYSTLVRSEEFLLNILIDHAFINHFFDISATLYAMIIQVYVISFYTIILFLI